MTSTWSTAPLKQVLTKPENLVDIQPDQVYRQITVRLWGGGVVLRNEVSGAEIAAKRRYAVRCGQFVLSRIDARNGAFGLVPESLDGAVVSNDFPSFNIDRQRLAPRFLDWMSKTQGFIDLCKVASEGTTNRVRLKVDRFLEIEIPLPPLAEQRRVVARIEELAALIEEARGLRAKAREEGEVLVSSALSHLFNYQTGDGLPNGWDWRSLPELLIDGKEGMKTGPFGTLLHKSDIKPEGIPILGIANVQANRFVPGFSDYVSPEKAQDLSSYELQEGDIVVARSGTVGRSCVVPPELDPAPIMSTNLIRLRLNTQSFLPELLSRLFNGSLLIERHKESECRGSTRSFFTQEILSRLQVPVPPLPEQRRMLAHLKDLQARVDELTALQEATQAELDALLPSVLDRAFRGEL
jgi:type I restriction enzyme S subunit